MKMARTICANATPGGNRSINTNRPKISSVRSGTPRISSMKPTQNHEIAGSELRRPSASRMPSGNDSAITATATITFSRSPPHRSAPTSPNDSTTTTMGNANSHPTSSGRTRRRPSRRPAATPAT
jgi:hypothetical protein